MLLRQKKLLKTLCFLCLTCSDSFLDHYWFSFFVSQTVHEGRIYQLKLFCDKDYPEKPPSVRFHSRINMTCVNHETGMVYLHYQNYFTVFLLIIIFACFICKWDLFQSSWNLTKLIYLLQVEPKKFGLLANWQREYTMEDILTQLKKEMGAPHNRKLVQPPEGTYF